MKQFIVPEPFCLQPFYAQGELLELSSSFADNLRHRPFSYDIAHFHEAKKADKPWLKWRENGPAMFHLWEETNGELRLHYKKRDKKAAKEPMTAMIALLMDAIFWLNERAIASLVNWKVEIAELEIAPVNIVERIQFMLESPEHFHSYNQLKSLFTEVEKSYYRQLAIKK